MINLLLSEPRVNMREDTLVNPSMCNMGGLSVSVLANLAQGLTLALMRDTPSFQNFTDSCPDMSTIVLRCFH